MITFSETSQHFLAKAFSDHVQIWLKERKVHADAQKWLSKIAYFLSVAVSNGYVYLPLEDLDAISQINSEIIENESWPSLTKLRQLLLESNLVGTPKKSSNFPMILDEENRLYLHRYYAYEATLAKQIQKLNTTNKFIDKSKFASFLNDFFGITDSQTLNWQKIATALALRQQLTIISGGPGTGKTTTVVNILACFLKQNPNTRIMLAAPTGKAAMRMLEAIRNQINRFPEELQKIMPNESQTIHRLLGVSSRPGIFRYNENNPLPLDVLVIDEASMIDLALASRLFEALPPHAHLIMLGDKDQLSAVEPGSIFSELSANPALTPSCITDLSDMTGIKQEIIIPPQSLSGGFVDNTIWFSQNFRFKKDSGISQLALSIKNGEIISAKKALNSEWKDNSITWKASPSPSLLEKILIANNTYLKNYVETIKKEPHNKKSVFEVFDRFRILCAIRESFYGVSGVNTLISSYIRNELNISPNQEWYVGRPVMVLQNDYTMRLFNGDIGIVLPNEKNTLVVYFPSEDESYRALALENIPVHETAFAMTIHKSQGSEFDSVTILMPPNYNPVITRELLYTAVTRARHQVLLLCNENVLEEGIQTSTKKYSGLMSRIKELNMNLI